MRKVFKTVVIFMTLCCATACGDDQITEKDNGGNQENTESNVDDEDDQDEEETVPEPVIHITPIEQLNQSEETVNSHADITARSQVKMNYRTYTEVQTSSLYEPNQHYPRIKKMANGNYIMFYQKGSSKSSGIGQRCHWAVSGDLVNWQHKGDVFTSRTLTDSEGNEIKRYYANCDAVVLKNGDILAVASYRGDNYRVNTQYDGVEMRRSTDNGQTWGDYKEIFKGGVTWEPYIIELASGEIQCYFTDSNRTGIDGHGQDTGVAMVTSNDGGETWNPAPADTPYQPYYVLRMAWEQNGERMFNHQMPCVIQLNESGELAAAMESHPGEEDYHISLAYSGEDGQWDYLAFDQEGPEDSQNMQFLGSAPYLIQFPSGETLLSYNRGGFHLKMGDANARNFEETPYDPFKGGFWGSLCLVDAHRAVGTIPHASDQSVIVAQLILNHRINATPRAVLVDGDNKEWENTDHALFVGDKTQAQATLRVAYDEENVYFLAEVLDNSMSNSTSDYVTVYVSPVTANDELTGEAFRVNVAPTGLRSVETYANGAWKETERDVTVDATQHNGSDVPEDERGYIAEIAVPRAELNISGGELLVNFSITKNYGEQDAIQKGSSTDTSRWIPVGGLEGE